MTTHPRLRVLTLATCLLTLLTGCRDSDSGPDEVSIPLTRVVAFAGNIPDATFYYRPAEDDLHLVTLTAPGLVVNTDDLSVRQCCVLTYTLDANGSSASSASSGSISPISISPITTLPAKEVSAAKIKGWDDTPVYLLSIWRSGMYINVHCRLPYNTSPRVIDLAANADEATSSTASLYLMHSTPAGDLFDREYYISFSLHDFMEDHPTVETLLIHVNNSNLKQDLFTLTAPAPNLITAAAGE